MHCALPGALTRFNPERGRQELCLAHLRVWSDTQQWLQSTGLAGQVTKAHEDHITHASKVMFPFTSVAAPCHTQQVQNNS